MTVQHYLIGYGKGDGRPHVEFAVPPDQLAAVKRLLALYPNDPDALDPYELPAADARQIAELIGQHVQPYEYDFFLQAFEVPEHAA